MAEQSLIAIWIESPVRNAPLGFGVTAWSLDDALTIIGAFGYAPFLPDDRSGLRVTQGVTVDKLDHSHVVANMGPIAVRGLWYPFVAVGIPQWVQDRISQRDIGL